MFILTLFLLAVLFVVYNLILIVQMREACVIQRLGKFKAVLEPGLHFLIPFVDRVAYRHEMREQCINIPPQGCISGDNIQIDVDGLVYLKVMEPYKASYGIENYIRAAINLAQTTMRSEIGKLKLSQTFSERESLNEKIVMEIDKASAPWGIKVLRYEVMNIIPSHNVIQTLEKQMEAERERRAEVTRANAEKDSTINVSQGERQEAINISEGEKRRRINEANGKAAEINIIADATAKGIEMVSEAIDMDGGRQAMRLRLLGSFVSQVGEIIETADVSVVPAEMAQLKGFFEGMDQVTHAIKENNS